MTRFALFLSVLLLAACSGAAPATETVLSTPETSLEPTATQAPVPTEATSLDFETSTYRDEQTGLELDYPATWTFLGGEDHSRGYYRQIVSWEQEGSGISEIPEGGSLIQITVTAWEPVNDMAARLEMRRGNFTASGNVIAEEETLMLPSGVEVVRWLLETTEGQSVIYLTTLNDLYLEISGSGDLTTVDASIQTLRIDGVSP